MEFTLVFNPSFSLKKENYIVVYYIFLAVIAIKYLGRN